MSETVNSFHKSIKDAKCVLYPRLKGYNTYEEGLKARKRKYGVNGAGAEPTFLCECGKYHVDIIVANKRAEARR